MSHAADLWELSLTSTDEKDGVDRERYNGNDNHLVHNLYRETVQHYVVRLRQHSGACLWLSLSSAAMAMEAYKDWQQYSTSSTSSRKSTWKELSLALWQSQRPLPFFLRPSVALTSAGALALVFQLYGGFVFWQPEAPMYYQTGNTRG
ncbi:expressed unknown protein [Seminavis robusta]|uniref:Uncharacterized protein n=1 Tax=Seminavis robusta TaxID=568900 RepID=A0A9N8HDT5_9STRA|nr:expressed unknown protein [Seminavis robusta]|eukprot:Sro478_g151010.1 n/a (148) ;mRNA; f:28415-28858